MAQVPPSVSGIFFPNLIVGKVTELLEFCTNPQNFDGIVPSPHLFSQSLCKTPLNFIPLTYNVVLHQNVIKYRIT